MYGAPKPSRNIGRFAPSLFKLRVTECGPQRPENGETLRRLTSAIVASASRPSSL
jgi:hypothetical protein